MATVVISEYMAPPGREVLHTRHDVVYDPDLHADRERLTDLASGAAALIVRNRTAVDGVLIAAAPELKAVGRLGVGLDNIDLEACAERDIAVLPAVGANAIAVAEYVIGALLVLARGAYGSTQDVIAGNWPRSTIRGRELYSKRLGLVGFGAIAREVASRAAGLGMEVAAFDPLLPEDDPAWESAVQTSLEALLSTSDAISIHVPLTDATRRLIDADRLAAMAPGAVLINTSRGGIVDEAAVVDALRAGRLAGAALDVFEHEPLDPAAGSQFSGVPNLLLTPHVAGLTVEANDRISLMVAAAVAEHLERTS